MDNMDNMVNMDNMDNMDNMNNMNNMDYMDNMDNMDNMGYMDRFNNLNGTESLISTDYLCKDGNVRFSTILLKPCWLTMWKISSFFCLEKCFYSGVISKKNAWVTFEEKPQMKISSLKKQKHGYLIILDYTKLLMVHR